jgi:integrase/recombinase XerC
MGDEVQGTLSAAAEEYAAWVARTRLSPRTRERYAEMVTRFAGWAADRTGMYDDMPGSTDVRDFAASDYRRELLVNRRLAPATVALHMAALNSFLEWHGIGRAPDVGVAVPAGDKVGITGHDDLRAIVRAARLRGARDHAIILTIAPCGPRLSELVGLDVDDVYLTASTGLLRVRYGKGGQPRQVSVPSQARDALKAWLRERARAHPGPQTGPLFTSRTGTRMAPRTVQDVVAAVGKAAGVELSPHILRHTFGRRWVENGGDVATLQAAMGHRNVNTTMRYTRPSREYMDEMAERLELPR